MKNVPIIGKILVIIAAFGVFVLGVTVYSTGRMRSIGDGYTALGVHENAGALETSRAGRFAVTVRAATADLLISTDEAGNRRAGDELTKSRASMLEHLDKAMAALPADPELTALKTRALAVMDEDCAQAVKLGRAATSPADVASS